MGDAVVFWDEAEVEALADRPAVGAVLDRVAAEAVQIMKRLTPVSPVGPLHRSGNLRSSIRAVRLGNQHGRQIIVGPTADYARYVNDDTRPHIIQSHGPYPLRNRETGKIFGHRQPDGTWLVHHPGTTGKHFIEKTADALNGRVFH
jgi:hypothetical protein